MLDNVECDVKTANELTSRLRDILSLDQQERGDEICGTLHIHYTDESVKQAGLVPVLEERGVKIEWHKK